MYKILKLKLKKSSFNVHQSYRDRILNKIAKINVSMSYKKKTSPMLRKQKGVKELPRFLDSGSIMCIPTPDRDRGPAALERSGRVPECQSVGVPRISGRCGGCSSGLASGKCQLICGIHYGWSRPASCGRIKRIVSGHPFVRSEILRDKTQWFIDWKTDESWCTPFE